MSQINTSVNKDYSLNYSFGNSIKSTVSNISNQALSTVNPPADQTIEVENMDMTQDTPENISLSNSEYKNVVEEYSKYLEEQKKMYQAPLLELDKMIAALELLEVSDYRQWHLKYKDKYDLEELKKLSKTFPSFENKNEIKKYANQLRQDQSTLSSTVYKLDQLEKTAEYDNLSYLNEYQNFEPTHYGENNKIDLNVLFSKVYEGNLESYCKNQGIDINKIDELELLKDIKQNHFGAYSDYYKDSELDYLVELNNENMIKTYQYIFQTQGKKKADKYLTDMKDYIHQSIGEKRANEFLSTLSKDANGNYDKKAVVNYLNSIKKGGSDGWKSFFQGLEAWFEKDNVYNASEYEGMFILEALQKNQEFSNLLDNTYEISQSVGNMVPSILIGTAATPIAGTAAMGISAGGNSYHNAKVMGYDKVNAFAYGVLSGLSEATLQHYLGAIPGLNEVDVKSLKTFVQAMAKEGVEEGSQEYIDALLRSDLLGENFNLEEISKNAGKSAIYGALIGGLFNGGNLAKNKILTNDSVTTSQKNVSQINSSSLAPNVKDQLNSVILTMDQNYGVGKGIERLKKVVQTGNYENITRKNGARDIVKGLSMETIQEYINMYESQNINKVQQNIEAEKIGNLEHKTPSLFEIFDSDGKSNRQTIERLCIALNNSLKCGNKDVNAVVNKLARLKKAYPHLNYQSDTYDSSYWLKSLGKIELSKNAINNNISSTMFHETGHLLFDMELSGKMSGNWKRELRKAKKVFLKQNTQNFFDFQNQLIDIRTKTYSKAWDILLQNLESENVTYDQYYQNLVQKYQQEYLNSSEALRKRLEQSGFSEEKINRILKNSLSPEEMASQEVTTQIEQLRDIISRVEYGEYGAISDIVDAVFYGKLDYVDGVPVSLSYLHGKEYYKNSNASELAAHEVIADYTSLKLNYPHAIPKLEGLFGKDFVDMLDDTFYKMVK